MREIFLHRLPVRLAGLILLLSGATLLVLTEINRRAVERILIEQAEVQAAGATNAVTEGLDGVAGGAERMARYVARELAGRVPGREEAERIAARVVADNPNVHGFALAFEPGAGAGAPARLGVAVHRSRRVEQTDTFDLTAPEQTYWTRDWYREVIDKGHVVWSEPYFDRGGSERNAVRVAVPVFRHETDDRTPIGAVAAVIDLDWLRRLANVNEFSDTSFTVIFSRSGRLILHPKATYVIAETIETLAEKTNTPELAAIRQAVLARRQGATAYTEPLPRRRVHVNYKPAKTAGWGVIVGYDEAEFLKSQTRYRRITAVFIVSLLAVLSGIVIWVVHTALRPLAALAGAADEIAKKNLDCAVPEPARPDEVGRLTAAFRNMRDALRHQSLERRWAAQAVEHQNRYNQLIIDSIREQVFVLTKALNISRVNPAVLQATGLAEADLVKAPFARQVRLAEGGDIAAVLGTALKENRPLRDLAATLRGKNGTEQPAWLSLVPLCDGGRVVGGVVTLRTR